MRNVPQCLCCAQRCFACALIIAGFALAGCRQWADHDHTTHDHAIDNAKVRKPKWSLDDLRDERAIAVDRHMDGKKVGMGVRRGVRDGASAGRKSPIDENPADSYLPATESENTDQ